MLGRRQGFASGPWKGHIGAMSVRNRLRLAASIIAAGPAAMLGFAYYTQYVEGLMPCILCLYQRPPHFAAAGLGFLAFLSVGGPKALPRLFLGLAALALLTGAGVALFHAGVELKFWKGLAECGGTIAPLPGDVGVLLQGMNATKIVACDSPSWIFLGLSMAAWNAVLSLGLAGLALWGMLQGRMRGRFRA